MDDLFEKLRAALAGEYRVERELGSGGMAIVFLAHDIKHERDVAIKILRPELSASLGSERFLREIKIAAKLSHPHILPLYDSGDADGLLYYVMPYIEGESLGDMLEREQQLSLDDGVRIAREVAEALAHAHSFGIVHRDIKPDNVMISGGHAVVSDFGIARALSAAGGDSLTQTGMAVGTPAYMSPEQAAGDPSVDARADVYSLGCMLYEMLVGQVPFTGPNAQAIMARHTMDMVSPPQIMRQSIPDELQDVILHAMEKTPADRFRTAGEFAEALKGVESGSYSAVRRPTMQRTAQLSQPKGRKWKKMTVPGASALAALLIGVGGWQLLEGGRSTAARDATFNPRRVGVLYFDDLSPGGELQYVADGLTEGLIQELSSVRGLDVISRNGVAPYRRGLVRADSIARILQTGSLVQGTVTRDGNRARITATLVEGTSGADFGRAAFELPMDDLIAAQDSVTDAVARLLRRRLGDEIEVRERRAGTKSVESWALVLRAEQLVKDATNQLRHSGPTAAIETHMRADSLLVLAAAGDRGWVEPPLLRARVAYNLSRLHHSAHEGSDHSEDLRWIRAGMAAVDRARELAPDDPRVLAMKGTLEHWHWRLDVIPDPGGQDALLAAARSDLEAAVDADPTIAEAHYVLSVLYYALEDNFSALVEARRAYEEDAYLSRADAILYQLFWTHYDLEQFTDAQRWCDEGARRFSDDRRFVQCRLWLMIAPGTVPDVDAAWGLLRSYEQLLPESGADFDAHLTRMIVGGVIGRAGLRDSAGNVLADARAGADVDPDQDLAGYEAVMRTAMGDYDGAIDLLRRYVAINPGHFMNPNGDLHWWWRPLRDEPGFRAVVQPR